MAMPVTPIELQAKVKKMDEKWVYLEVNGKKTRISREAVDGQNLKTNGKLQDIKVSPDDFFKMKQAYLLGLAK